MKYPFERLMRETPRHPDHKALLDFLGEHLVVQATVQPKSKKYDFYEYIDDHAEDTFGVTPEKLLSEMRKTKAKEGDS